MAENLEWKKMKPLFMLDPVLKAKSGRVLIRMNSVKIANLVASQNFRDRIIEKHETTNVMDVIAKKVMKERMREMPKKAENVMPVSVNCELLKSVFDDHETSIVQVDAVEISNKSKHGFISSHITSSATSSDSLDSPEADRITNDTKKKIVSKQLMGKEIYDQWLNDSPSSSATTTRALRQNPKDLGIFPQTTHFSRPSKKVFPKELDLDSLLQ